MGDRAVRSLKLQIAGGIQSKAALGGELDSDGVRVGLRREDHVVLELVPIPVIHDIDSRPDFPIANLGVIGQTPEQALRIIRAEVRASESYAIQSLAGRRKTCSHQLQLHRVGTLCSGIEDRK